MSVAEVERIMQDTTMLIDSVRIGQRYRRDLGNLSALAASINSVGLLHPVVVTPDGELIAGQRRLEACRLLGWTRVPVNVVDLKDIVRGEHDENAVRKDFLPSEMVAIGKALEPVEKEAARVRHDVQALSNLSGVPDAGNFPASENGRVRDKLASFVGVSGRTLEKAAKVVEAAQQEPEKFSDLVTQMDASQKVDRAYKELKKRQHEEAKQAVPFDLPKVPDRYRLIHADIKDFVSFRWGEEAYCKYCYETHSDWDIDGNHELGVYTCKRCDHSSRLESEIVYSMEAESIDAIITDPPYPREYLPVYEALAKAAAQLLKPGGSLLVMVGQSYLPEVLALITPHLRYHWTLAYLTPGGQAVQLFQRKVNTFWKPVLWFVKGDYKGDWVGDVTKSAVNDNDKRFHEWGQSESGMADLIERFTYPGQVICDPFLGGGTTGVVAVSMNRQFIGIDIDPAAIETAKRRLAEVL